MGHWWLSDLAEKLTPMTFTSCSDYFGLNTQKIQLSLNTVGAKVLVAWQQILRKGWKINERPSGIGTERQTTQQGSTTAQSRPEATEVWQQAASTGSGPEVGPQVPLPLQVPRGAGNQESM